MSNKNVDKKKMGADIKNQKQMVSLVKEASLFSGKQPLKAPTNFIGSLPEQGLELKEATLNGNKSFVLGEALFTQPVVTPEKLKDSIGILNQTTFTGDGLSFAFEIPVVDKKFVEDITGSAAKEQSSSNKEKPLLLTDGKELLTRETKEKKEKENSAKNKLSQKVVEKILECLGKAEARIKNPDLIDCIIAKLSDNGHLSEQLCKIIKQSGKYLAVLPEILNYQDLKTEIPEAMKFLEEKKVKTKSNRAKSQDCEISDDELKNILKAANLLIAIKASIGSQKFEATLKKGLNGELNWFGDNPNYQQEKTQGSSKKSKSKKKVKSSSLTEPDQELTFTSMVHSLVTGNSSNIRNKNLITFFSNIEFDIDTIEKINTILGMEEKETKIDNNIKGNKQNKGEEEEKKEMTISKEIGMDSNKDKKIKDSQLKDLDDLFGLKNKNVSDFTDDDKRKSKIKEILVKAISTVNDPSAISYLSSSESSFLSQSDNSSFLAKIIADINEKNAQIYGVARNVHNPKDEKEYKREILRQKFVLSGLLDPGSRKIIHQSINDEQLMLAFCKEANVLYRIILFGFLPEELQTIGNVEEIFADLKDENKGGNDNKDNRFERFVKATLARYRLGPEKNILEELKKLESEGKINLEAVTDQLKEAIENGDKLGAGITEVLEFLRGKLNSTKELKVPPAKTIVLLKTIWAKRATLKLEENDIEVMFGVLCSAIKNKDETVLDADYDLQFITDVLSSDVTFNSAAYEKVFALFVIIGAQEHNNIDLRKKLLNTLSLVLTKDTCVLSDAAIINAFDGLCKLGIPAKDIFDLIGKVRNKSNIKLSNKLISGMFSALTRAISKEENTKQLNLDDVFNLVYDILKSGSEFDNGAYSDMFSALSNIMKNNSDTDLSDTKIFLELIRKFREKDKQILNSSMIQFVFDMLVSIDEDNTIKIKDNTVGALDILNLISGILGENGNELNSGVVDSMLMALIGAINAGDITGLTTRPVLELINRVIKSRLNSGIMADLFKALVNENGVIESDDTIDSELLKDFFTLINNFAFKEQSAQGDTVRNSMLNAFFKLRQKCCKLKKEKRNKVELESKPDVVPILGQIKTFSKARKTNLLCDDVLAIVRTLESMMILGDLSQIDLNEYLPMFTEIWEDAIGMGSEPDPLSDIAQRMFGALLFAIKFGNKDNLANLKMKDVFQLYQNVLNALQGKTEAVIRPIFVALGYALENVKNVTTTQVYNLVKGSGILSDSNFQISIGTAQIIFSVLLIVLEIENRDENKVKSLFDAVNLDSIGLAFHEGKIELLDKSKAKDTISCCACINLFYTKLEEIFKEKIFKSGTKEIKEEKPKEAELPKAKENAEKGSKQSDYTGWFEKHSKSEVLITESADKNKNADVNQTNQTNAQPVPYSDWFERNKEKSKFGQKETNENESDKTNINNEMNKNDNLEKNLKAKSGNQENQTVEQVNNKQYATMTENTTVINLKNDQFKNDKKKNIDSDNKNNAKIPTVIYIYQGVEEDINNGSGKNKNKNKNNGEQNNIINRNIGKSEETQGLNANKEKEKGQGNNQNNIIHGNINKNEEEKEKNVNNANSNLEKKKNTTMKIYSNPALLKKGLDTIKEVDEEQEQEQENVKENSQQTTFKKLGEYFQQSKGEVSVKDYLPDYSYIGELPQKKIKDMSAEKFLTQLIKSNVDMSQITVQTLNGYFGLNITPNDVKVGFIEWLGMCLNMLFSNFGMFSKKTYHVSQHLLLIKYLDKAKSEPLAQNKTQKASLWGLLSKLKQNDPQIQNQPELETNKLNKHK